MLADWKNRIILSCISMLVLSMLLYSCVAYKGGELIYQAARSLSQIEAAKNWERVPTVITTSIKDIAGKTASSGGYIDDEGTSIVLSRGVCWGSSPTPTIFGNKTTDGAGAGSFSSNLTGLSGSTDYFVRAYATNSEGTGYGEAKFFATLGQSPSTISKTATNIRPSVATLNGSVNANYLSTVVYFEYGTTSKYGNTAAATQSPVEGNTETNVSVNISDLIMGTIYHYRIKATNSLGTTISKDMTFKTEVAD
jgi:hypothetical protein